MVGGTTKLITRHSIDLAIFSLLAMRTGPPEIGLQPRDELALGLVGIQVLLSITLIGLLGFVLGNRIRR